VKNKIKMTQYIITLKKSKVSDAFLNFIKNLDFVNSVEEINGEAKPLKAQDWAKPGRPATDEEFEQMIKEAEKDKGLSYDEAKNITKAYFEEWLEMKSK